MSRLNWDFGSPFSDGVVAPLADLAGLKIFILVSRRLGVGLAMGCGGGADWRCWGDARLP